MFNVKAIYSCDYGNQNEGIFSENIGNYKTMEEAKLAVDNFEMEVIAPNFLTCLIDTIK